MDLFLPRSEILRQLRSILGVASSDVIASHVGDQHVTFVQNAAREVALACKWINLRGEVTVDVQEEQQLVDYPESAGPGSCLGLAVWDNGEYYPLREKSIPVAASADQLEAAGEPTFSEILQRPTHFEQGLQVRLWPPTDKPYKLRFRYQRPVEMPTEESLSLVDAQAIILRAAGMAFEVMGDYQLADRNTKRSNDRIAKLRAFHQGNQDLQLNRDADMAEDEHLVVERPRWDTRPTIR